MKFDLSTILMVIVAVIPGLFAQRARNQLVPRSFAPQGASAELAELVALGVATHGILAFFAAMLLVILGWLNKSDPDYFFSWLDSQASQWYSKHPVETVLLAAAYLFLSFFFSYCLGFVYGLMRLKRPFTAMIFANASWLRNWLGVIGPLDERPILYDVLNPALSGFDTRTMFLEIEMKSNLGFYSGQLSQFAIVKDEEPHKSVFLIDVWFKKDRADEYDPVETDGIMIDLADAATLLVRQVEETGMLSEPGPTKEEIRALANRFWAESGFKDGADEQNWLRAEQQLCNRRPVVGDSEPIRK